MASNWQSGGLDKACCRGLAILSGDNLKINLKIFVFSRQKICFFEYLLLKSHYRMIRHILFSGFNKHIYSHYRKELNMARVINGLFSGKIGNLIYTIKKGQQFVRTVPDFSKRVVPDKMKKGMDCFSLAGSFNSAVYKIPVFMENWQKARIKCTSTINKIMKINYPILKVNEDISFLKLTADNDIHPVTLEQFSFTPVKISAQFITPVKAGLSTLASLQGIIYLTHPADTNMKPYCFIPFSTKNYEYTPGETFSLSTSISSVSSEIIKGYGSWKIMMNLAFKYEQGIVVCFSKTVVQ
jgi:hypothetical protein